MLLEQVMMACDCRQFKSIEKQGNYGCAVCYEADWMPTGASDVHAGVCKGILVQTSVLVRVHCLLQSCLLRVAQHNLCQSCCCCYCKYTSQL